MKKRYYAVVKIFDGLHKVETHKFEVNNTKEALQYLLDELNTSNFSRIEIDLFPT